ncbi:hypothetical protein [Mycobacterium sp. ENV421]|uniref:hypothetical protein n=1 Tax=Mycobacterium sp. ENV421 TaxID=1213407 RepID=UPI0018EB98C2|nr:hypothetical protein [Mycobacterium sp. ENV421]
MASNPGWFTYAHLRSEFENRLQQLQNCGQTPDPKAAHIQRLNTEVDKLRHRLAQADTTFGELTDFRTRALARLAAQHEEITRLRTLTDPNVNVTHLPRTRQKIIGPC